MLNENFEIGDINWPTLPDLPRIKRPRLIFPGHKKKKKQPKKAQIGPQFGANRVSPIIPISVQSRSSSESYILANDLPKARLLVRIIRKISACFRLNILGGEKYFFLSLKIVVEKFVA